MNRYHSKQIRNVINDTPKIGGLLYEENKCSLEDPLSALPNFDGSQNLEEYCALFENVMLHPRVYRVNIIKVFGSFLEGRALEWYQYFTRTHGYNWEIMNIKFIQEFNSPPVLPIWSFAEKRDTKKRKFAERRT